MHPRRSRQIAAVSAMATSPPTNINTAQISTPATDGGMAVDVLLVSVTADHP